MKKIIITIIFTMLFATSINAKTVLKTAQGRLVVTQSKVDTKVKWNKKVIRWYDFNGKVILIPERKLTHKILMKRKERFLYIERVVGRVINNRLDGRTSCGNYISYRSLKGKVKNGSIIVSYFIYCPYTRWTDDIDERYDIIVR